MNDRQLRLTDGGERPTPLASGGERYTLGMVLCGAVCVCVCVCIPASFLSILIPCVIMVSTSSQEVPNKRGNMRVTSIQIHYRLWQGGPPLTSAKCMQKVYTYYTSRALLQSNIIILFLHHLECSSPDYVQLALCLCLRLGLGGRVGGLARYSALGHRALSPCTIYI